MSCCHNRKRCCSCGCSNNDAVVLPAPEPCSCEEAVNTCSCSSECVDGCPEGCAAIPVPIQPKPIQRRLCCDQNGCCGLYPAECRNSFWPDFAHPRWLCCEDLYCHR